MGIQTTNKVLYTQKVGAGIYGQQVVEYAAGLSHLGYALVSENTKVLALSTNLELNVINFYYKEAVS